MKRLLFIILSALSFLAFVAALVIWDRSYLATESAMYGRADPSGDAFVVRGGSISWSQGSIFLSAYHASGCPRQYANPEGFNFSSRSLLGMTLSTRARLLTGTARASLQGMAPSSQLANGWSSPDPGSRVYHAFGFTGAYRSTEIKGQSTGRSFPHRTWSASIPCWFPALLAAILPALWLPRWYHWRLRQRRKRQGLCPWCSYDLRASKDRCPECGQPILPARTPPADSTQRRVCRSIGRWLFHVASAFSLLLLLATLVLWVRSYQSSDYLDWRRRSVGPPYLIYREDCLFSTTGLLAYAVRIREEYQSDFERKYPALEWTQSPPPLCKTWLRNDTPGWSYGGFAHCGLDDSTRWDWIHQGVRFYNAPHWAITLAAALLPIFWLFYRFRSRRTQP